MRVLLYVFGSCIIVLLAYVVGGPKNGPDMVGGFGFGLFWVGMFLMMTGWFEED